MRRVCLATKLLSALAGSLLLAGAAAAQTQPTQGIPAAPGLHGPARSAMHPRPTSSQAPKIFLLRGLANIFSLGMDTLGEKLQRRGLAVTVTNHAEYEFLANQVAEQYRAGSRGPVIIIGHSLGADAAVQMAARLNESHVPVALVVTFGPSIYPRVTPNVARVVNYYQENSTWHGKVLPSPGFRGQLLNINLDNAPDVNHFNIEKIDRLQNETVNRILAVVSAHRSAPPPAGPAASGADRAASQDASPVSSYTTVGTTPARAN